MNGHVASEPQRGHRPPSPRACPEVVRQGLGAEAHPSGYTHDERLLELFPLAATSPRAAELREELVSAYLPMVVRIAHRFQGRGEPLEDLIQVGTIGLLRSLERFDPERGSFIGFATPTIVGEIQRHFRDRGWAVRVPRRLQDLTRSVSRAREVLTHQLERSPTAAEIAGHLGVEVDVVLEAIESAGAFATVPLTSGPDETEPPAVATWDENLEIVELRATLGPLVREFQQRDQKILVLRFVRNLSQSQIAAEVGISQMHVSRRINRCLDILRAQLTEPD